MTNCLLVEPDYKTKYPNLALMKISTKLKQEGKTVTYIKGIKPRVLNDDEEYDEIYITSLFTYESEKVLQTVKFYKQRYKHAKIMVGGIFATLNAKLVEKETGIKPFLGYSKELDMVKPDYDLTTTGTKWDDFSFVFTSRGCVNHCPFCAVPRLEPDLWLNPNWKQAIDFRRKNVMIHDNNLTALPMSHFKDVTTFLKKHQLGVIFDNGFDCRIFNQQHLTALQGVKILKGGLRFAFDTMQSDGYIQKTLKLCLDSGISKSKLTVFILFNFMDTPQEAEHRMTEIIKLGVRVYPQQYVPLNKLSRLPIFVGKHWTEDLVRAFRRFYLMMGYYTKYTFTAWRQRGFDLSKAKLNDLRTDITEKSKIRRLTPIECERLQGFPDGWTEGLSDTQRYKTLGNAVTVNVIEFLGKKLKYSLFCDADKYN